MLLFRTNSVRFVWPQIATNADQYTDLHDFVFFMYVNIPDKEQQRWLIPRIIAGISRRTFTVKRKHFHCNASKTLGYVHHTHA